MAATAVGTRTVGDGSGGVTPVVVPVVSGIAEGDRLFVLLVSDNDGTLAAMTGNTAWTELSSSVAVAVAAGLGKVYSKRASADDVAGGSYSFPAAVTSDNVGLMWAWRGHNDAQPVATITWAKAAAASTSSLIAPAVTPPANGALFSFWLLENGTTGTSGTPPAPMVGTSYLDTSLFLCLLGAYQEGGASTGVSTGTKTATFNSTGNTVSVGYLSMSMVIADETPPGVVVTPHPAGFTPWRQGPAQSPAIGFDTSSEVPATPTASGDVSDTVTRTSSVAGARADAGDVTQSATRTSAAAGARADTGSVSQTATRTSTVTGLRTDSGAATQSIARTATVAGARADSGAVTQTTSRTATTAGARADSGTASQTVTRTASVAGARKDTGSASQTATRTQTSAGLRTDATTASQTTTRTNAASGARADSGSAAQTAARTAAVTGSTGGSGDVTQSITRTATAAGARADTGSVSQTATRTQSAAGHRADSGAVTQSAARTNTVSGHRADAGAVSQVAVRVALVAGSSAAPGMGSVNQSIARSASVVGLNTPPPTNGPAVQAITRLAVVVGKVHGGARAANGWYGLLSIIKEAQSYELEQPYFDTLDCPFCGTVMRDHHCPFDGYAERGAEAVVQKGGGSMWGQLIAMREEADLFEKQDAATPLSACPECGQTLLPGPDGRLFCPFDGWRDEGRLNQ